GKANLKFTVFGMEADDFNSIMYGQTFDAAGNPQNFIGLGNPDPANTNIWDPNGLGSFMVNNVAAGLIDFSFANIAGFAKADNSSNGYALANALPNFFLSIAGNAAATVGNSVWMFLDDSGGIGPNGGPNGDYDDLIVRMDVIPTTAPIPVPAAGFLLVGALGGLGLMRRRQKA
ncbi:MAG: VPLPA-CTERM sorting domain-containing protein, partial [Paracoccaceae bacterium]